MKAGRESTVCVASAGRCDFTCGQITVPPGNGHMRDSHGKRYLMQRAELSVLICPKFLICVHRYCIRANPGKKKDVGSFTFSLVSFCGKVKNSKREEVKFGSALVLKMLLLYGSYGLGLTYTKNFLAVSGSCPILWAHACGIVSYPRM